MRHIMLMGCAALALAAAAPAIAQTAPGYAVPHMADGRPDLEGIWTNSSITKMTRPPTVSSLVLSAEEAKKLEGADYYNNRKAEDAKPIDVKTAKLLDGSDLLSGGGYNGFWVDPGSKVASVKGELRSSWITDPPSGRIPYKTGAPGAPAARPAAGAPGAPTGAAKPGSATVQGPGAVDRNAGGGFGSYNGPETRPIGERCLIGFGNTGGPVMNNVLYNNHYQVVQAPDYVIINVEMAHDARIIPLVKDRAAAEATPVTKSVQPWLGQSVGWYEGDALLILTRNVNPAQRGYISPSGKVIERLSRWNADQITYEFTVEDATRYSQPWKGEIAWNHSKEGLYEYACHEGNYAMPGILAGARKQEREGKMVKASSAEE